jgi:predicted AAA+ superfamily ATPase
MYIPRLLNLPNLLKSKSYFLLGPRQTGKSQLIAHTLSNYRVYNLLESETFLRLSHSPQRLREELMPQDKWIIIDEIQKLPHLLDEVHLIIEKYSIHFLLTGSSARKLKRSGVNLLGGRARMQAFHPLIYMELKEQFDLTRALNHGLLPSHYFSDAIEQNLQAYVGMYLKEEIAAEGLTRNVPAFSRFLEVAALCNAQLINFSKIANDAQVARTTVHEYFEILKDTLLAYEVPAWKKTKKRKPLSTSKFYFFDTGVVRSLQHRSHVQPGSPEFGEGFETYICHELHAFVDYCAPNTSIHYWRSTSGLEVDFIVGDTLAIEVKSSSHISHNDLKGLKALQEENTEIQHYLVVCLEKIPRRVGNIDILPWEIFLKKLFEGGFAL